MAISTGCRLSVSIAAEPIGWCVRTRAETSPPWSVTPISRCRRAPNQPRLRPPPVTNGRPKTPRSSQAERHVVSNFAATIMKSKICANQAVKWVKQRLRTASDGPCSRSSIKGAIEEGFDSASRPVHTAVANSGHLPLRRQDPPARRAALARACWDSSGV